MLGLKELVIYVVNCIAKNDAKHDLFLEKRTVDILLPFLFRVAPREILRYSESMLSTESIGSLLAYLRADMFTTYQGLPYLPSTNGHTSRIFEFRNGLRESPGVHKFRHDSPCSRFLPLFIFSLYIFLARSFVSFRLVGVPVSSCS